MNREQRRAQKRDWRREWKKTPQYKKMTKEQVADALVKNGITPKMLEQEYVNGYNTGYDEGTKTSFKTIYAAVSMVLHDMHGFGKQRCKKVLEGIESCIVQYLTGDEAVDAALERVGLHIDFDEGIDRIKESE